MARQLTYLLAFVWTFIGTAIFTVGIELTRLYNPGAAHDLVTLGAWDALGFAAAGALVVRLYAEGGPSLSRLGIRATHPWLSALGLLLGVALHGPADSLRQLVELWLPLSEREMAARAAMFAELSAVRVVLIVLIAGCLAPVLEEIFFRGALFGALRQTHAAWGTVIVTSLCFVASHQNVRLWLPVLVAAAVLGFLRHSSGSILPCLALHVSFNTVTLVPALSGIAPSYENFSLGVGFLVAGWIASGALGYVAWRIARSSREAEAARLQDER